MSGKVPQYTLIVVGIIIILLAVVFFFVRNINLFSIVLAVIGVLVVILGVIMLFVIKEKKCDNVSSSGGKPLSVLNLGIGTIDNPSATKGCKLN